MNGGFHSLLSYNFTYDAPYLQLTYNLLTTHRLGVGLQLAPLGPLVAHGVGRLARPPRGARGFDRLRVREAVDIDGRSEDEGVVALVDVGREEGRGLGIGARDDERGGAEDVRLG